MLEAAQHLLKRSSVPSSRLLCLRPAVPERQLPATPAVRPLFSESTELTLRRLRRRLTPAQTLIIYVCLLRSYHRDNIELEPCITITVTIGYFHHFTENFCPLELCQTSATTITDWPAESAHNTSAAMKKTRMSKLEKVFTSGILILLWKQR